VVGAGVEVRADTGGDRVDVSPGDESVEQPVAAAVRKVRLVPPSLRRLLR
jgi:hypothetical protein